MGSCQYAVIQRRGAAIELQVTDPSTVNQLLDVLSTSIAGFGASACKLPGGDLYYWRLYGLGENVERVWGLIVEHFCARGWAALDDPPVSSQVGSVHQITRCAFVGGLQGAQSVRALPPISLSEEA